MPAVSRGTDRLLLVPESRETRETETPMRTRVREHTPQSLLEGPIAPLRKAQPTDERSDDNRRAITPSRKRD